MNLDKALRAAGETLREPPPDAQETEERIPETIRRLREDPAEARRVEDLAAELDREEMNYRLGHEALESQDFGTAEYCLRLAAEQGSDEAAYWLALLLQYRSMRQRLAGRSKKAQKLAAEARKWRLGAQESGLAEALDSAYADDVPFFGDRHAGESPLQPPLPAWPKEPQKDRPQSARHIRDDVAEPPPSGGTLPERDDCVAVGIEVQPNQFNIVLVDGDGEIISENDGRLSDMKKPEAVVGELAAAAREIVTSRFGPEFPADRVALGVQLGGPVDTKTGTVHFFSKHPPGLPNGPSDFRWQDFSLGPRLQEETGFRTVVLNDAVAFAERERWIGVGRQTGDFVVMLIREGVGGAIVSDGQHFKGPVEIGNFRYSSASFEQSDADQWGALEVDGGTTGVTRHASEKIKRPVPDLDAVAALADGDGPGRDAASNAFLSAGIAISLGLSYLVQVAGPSHAVLYAPAAMLRKDSRAGRNFLGQVNKFTEAVAFEAYRNCELVLRPTGVNDGAQGAAQAGLTRCFRLEPTMSPASAGARQ